MSETPLIYGGSQVAYHDVANPPSLPAILSTPSRRVAHGECGRPIRAARAANAAGAELDAPQTTVAVGFGRLETQVDAQTSAAGGPGGIWWLSRIISEVALQSGALYCQGGSNELVALLDSKKNQLLHIAGKDQIGRAHV